MITTSAIIKKRTSLLAAAAVLCLSLLFTGCPSGKSPGKEEVEASPSLSEITLRNVTNRTVSYSIKKMYTAEGFA